VFTFVINLACLFEAHCSIALDGDVALASCWQLGDGLINEFHLDRRQDHHLDILEELSCSACCLLLAWEWLRWLLDQVGRHLNEGLVELPDNLKPLSLDFLGNLLQRFVLEFHVANLEVRVGVDILQIFRNGLELAVHFVHEFLVADGWEFLDKTDELIVLFFGNLEQLVVNDVLKVGNRLDRETEFGGFRVDFVEIDTVAALRLGCFFFFLNNLCFALGAEINNEVGLHARFAQVKVAALAEVRDQMCTIAM